MKIGILTMHRVKNIGSVLQAYATQKAFEQLGHEAEIIDYEFVSHKPMTLGYIISSLKSFILNTFGGFHIQKYNRRIRHFYNTWIKCSQKSYNQKTINQDYPRYDIYCTGSDQVWNPRYIDKDVTFMLAFTEDTCKRISYASSFATDMIPSDCKTLYSRYLSRYEHISVREQTGVELAKSLTGKDVTLVCDPTLLLDSVEWQHIGRFSATHIEKPYILVYFLGYMFDPRPYLYGIVSDVQQKMNLPVYYINGGHHEMKQPHTTVLRGQGPSEFIELVHNADFLITDSFHGTAFASIFNIPMIGIVKSLDSGDDRIGSLRKKVGGEKSLVKYDAYDKSFSKDFIDDYKCDIYKVKQFREDSMECIKKMLIV